MSEESGGASQIPLSFAAQPPKYDRQDFIIGDANKNALAIADSWIASNEIRLAICGPEGAGKTHLATIVLSAFEPDAMRITGDALSDIPENVKCLLIDNVHLVRERKRLFLIIEDCRASKVRLVLSGRGQPSEWAHELKDLQTRMEAMPRIDLSEPDEELLRAVIQKLFLDRQLRVDPAVSAYAAPRLPRTFAAAQGFVAACDALAAEKRSAITKVLAGNVINNLSVDPFRS